MQRGVQHKFLACSGSAHFYKHGANQFTRFHTFLTCGTEQKEKLWKAITADAVEKRKQDDLEKADENDMLVPQDCQD